MSATRPVNAALDQRKFAFGKFYYYVEILSSDYFACSTDLLVDGGSESNNVLVETFLSDEKVPIRKIIAQKDIVFSNSMIESVNKLLKYRYLFNHEIRDIDHLIQHLEYFIPVYNGVRPHISLKGLTPNEVFNGITLNKEELKEQTVIARDKMITENRNSACTVCSG